MFQSDSRSSKDCHRHQYNLQKVFLLSQTSKHSNIVEILKTLERALHITLEQCCWLPAFIWHVVLMTN